jgi:RNA polymerase sigma factor (sigma-70 family)
METEKTLTCYTPLIRSLARRYVGPGSEFEDLVQEGYLALLKLLPRCRNEAALPAFLAKALRRALRDSAAKGWRRGRPIIDGDVDKYEETLAAEPDLNLAAWGLNPEDEHLLRLLLDGLSQKEAGLRLGLSQQAVSRRLKGLGKSL